MQKLSSGVAVARAVCLTQLAIAAAAAVIAGIWAGRANALASVYGGVVAVVPTVYFAVRAFSGTKSGNPQALVGAFYLGEMGKMALTALLFAVGVGLFAKQFLALIVTYAACLLAYWLVVARVVINSGKPD